MFGPEVAPVGAPFGALHMIEGMFRHGEAAAALRFIRDYWGGMLGRGATTFWDDFSLAWGPGAVPGRNTSLCHGWAAGPTYCLPARVLGVRPAEPAFRAALIQPQPGGLAWARGKVPTPGGPIEVSWSVADAEFALEVTLPQGCRGRVSLPPEFVPAAEVKLDGKRVGPENERGHRALSVEEGRHAIAARARR
jgi:hypothetical protein